MIVYNIPLCLKEFKITSKKKVVELDSHKNEYYQESAFIPVKFYKQIVKL